MMDLDYFKLAVALPTTILRLVRLFPQWHPRLTD